MKSNSKLQSKINIIFLFSSGIMCIIKYHINYCIVELYHIEYYYHNHFDNSNYIINHVYLYILCIRI